MAFWKGWNKKEIQINPKFEKMSHEELLETMYKLKEENNKKKETSITLTEENKELKDSILNKSKNNLGVKNIYNDFKSTFFSSNDSSENFSEKNKDFNDFIYDQYLLYGGLEEEDINDLNQFKINEDNWSDNKDFFIFKQKIIERNYQELFRNMAASNELHNLFKTEEENMNGNNINEDNINNNTNDNNINEDNKINKNDNEIKEENKGDKLSSLSDKIENEHKDKKNQKQKNDKVKEKEKEDEKENNGKEKENEKEKGKEQKEIKEKKSSSEINKFNSGRLNPLNNIKKKEEEKNYFDDLLNNENDEEE